MSDLVLVDAARCLDAVKRPEIAQMYSRLLKKMREHLASHREPLNITPLPFPSPISLCATFIPHWADPLQSILWVEAEAFVRDYTTKSAMWVCGAQHGISEATATHVVLFKSQAIGI